MTITNLFKRGCDIRKTLSVKIKEMRTPNRLPVVIPATGHVNINHLFIFPLKVNTLEHLRKRLHYIILILILTFSLFFLL